MLLKTTRVSNSCNVGNWPQLTQLQLDAVGIRPSNAAKRLQREAYKAWLTGILFNTVLGIYTLYRLHRRQQRLDRKEGEGAVEMKKLEK